ncbi:prephenate dehydrogenase [Streptomyces violaceorubidus]
MRALRALQSSDEDKRREGGTGIAEVLRRGNAGRVRVRQARLRPAGLRDGGRPHRRPAGPAGPHLRGRRTGRGQHRGRAVDRDRQPQVLVQLMVEPKAAAVLTAALKERGWAIRQ